MVSGGAGAAADGGGGSFESALAALREANGGLVPSDVWRGGVLPFLANSDVLRLSGACRSLLPVAAAGLRSLLGLRVPEGGAVEQLASLLQRAPHAVREVRFAGVVLEPDAVVIAIAESCPALTSLDVSFCTLLTDASIQAIAENCPALTSLRVDGCELLTDASIQAIAENCPALTSLDVDGC